MQIKSLTLKNFRGFRDTEITFSEGLTVLVGVNGAGKSSVLDALAMLMSWPVARLQGQLDRPQIPVSDAHQRGEALDAEIPVSLEFICEHSNDTLNWRLTLDILDMENLDQTSDKVVATFARRLKLDLFADIPVPIMVYYPTVRAVIDVPIPPPASASLFDSRETYVNALPARSENFHSFFKWFRAREDYENERIRDEGNSGTRDIHLETVRKALSQFLPYISGLVVKRFLDALVAEKHGVTIRVDRFSDGEKLVIAIVGDIVRRLVLANPESDRPLEGTGVVLIDEIEQHLHPKWQRTIIGNLRRTFPNIQFIVSTHSPQVLGEVEHSNIRCIIVDEDGSPTVSTPTQSLGLDANLILEELFGAPSRNKEVATELTNIFREIDKEDTKSLAKARREIKKLKKKLNGEIPDLVEAEAMLFMLENQ